MTLTSSGIRIENTNAPLLSKIDMTPLQITDSNSGNSITFQRLCYLPIGLSALEAPPNPTTLHIQDAILIDKLSTDISNTVSFDNVLIQDTSGGAGDVIQSQLTSSLLSITNTSGFGNPNLTNIYSGTITLLNDVLDNCALSSNGLQFNTPSSGNTNSVYNTGGTDLNITGSNQLNLGSGDNINLNCGVNCIINVPSGGNNILLNSLDGTCNIGDYNQNYNGTYYSLNDTNQQIITNTHNGLIWNGDINAIGSGASSQFNVAHRYISNFCGKMSSVDEVNNTISTKIEEYGNFFISDVDIQMKEVPNYLNPLTHNGDGWYCYIMNYTGGDINLTSNDGKQFIGHSFGGFNSNCPIKKYATVRVTLTYITPLGDYYWSVMQF